MLHWKKFVGILLILSACMCYASDEISVQIRPENITLSDSGALIVSLPADAGNPKLDLPQVDGIRWNNRNRRSQHISIINGKHSGSVQLQFGFDPQRAGEVTIPALTVTTSDGKELRSAPVSFTIKKVPTLNTDEARAAELAFITLTPADPDRKIYYTGERITLHLNICFRTTYSLNYNPEIRFQAVPEKSIFIEGDRKVVRQGTVSVNGVRFYCYVIAQNAVVSKEGRIEIGAHAGLSLRDNNSFFGDNVRKNCSAECAIDVKSLPAPPDNAPYSGVIGSNFQIQNSKIPDSVRAGEPITVRFQLSGNANWNNFQFPEQKINGIRCYPPEVSAEDNSLTVEQTLIPLKSGSVLLDIAFSVFDTASGEYRPVFIRKMLQVEPGSETIAPDSAETKEVDQKYEHTIQDEIFYLMDDTEPLTLPLWRNAVIPSLVLILSAILIFGALYFFFFRKKLFAQDPAYLQKCTVRAMHEDLLIRLKRDEQPSAMTDDLTTYLASALNLPPGASLADVADAVEKKDPAFAAMLRELAADSWNPAGGKLEMSGEQRKKFRASLAKLTVLLLLFFLPAAVFADSAGHAYDHGSFQEALDMYLQRIQPGKAAASDLYNAGNCYCELNDHARALVMYERALKLDPQNKNIRANRDALRRHLDLPEKEKFDSPGDFPAYLRRLLRVDQWIIAGVAGAILAFGTTGFFFIYRRKILIVLIAAGAIVMIVAAVAALSAHQAEMNEKYAIIVSPGTKVYSLPSANGTVRDELEPGCEVVAGECRQKDWIRIQYGEKEGWILRKDLLPLKLE